MLEKGFPQKSDGIPVMQPTLLQNRKIQNSFKTQRNDNDILP